MVPQGFEVGHKGRCATVFSAPNYCGGNNFGALMRFSNPEAMMSPVVLTFSGVEKRKRKKSHSI